MNKQNRTMTFLLIIVLQLLFDVRSFGAKPSERNKVIVHCKTTKGPLEIVVMRDWSPKGVARFLELVDDGFYSGLPLFRCINGFLCQFGASLPRAKSKTYSAIPDDPKRPDLRAFKSGYVSFAGYGPNSRSTHAFITLAEVESLGSQPWETPIGFVSEATMRSTVSRFTTSYGETAPTGGGPDPRKIESAGGQEYLRDHYPLLDSFLSCSRFKQ